MTMTMIEAEALLEQWNGAGCATRFLAEPIPEAVLERILEAACRAPSPWNLQPWQFVVVRSPEGRELLLRHAAHPGPARGAPVLLLALGDPAAWKQAPERLAELVAEGQLDPRDEALELELIRRHWSAGGAAHTLAVARTHAALQQLGLAALAFGVGVCWVHDLDVARLARALHIPANLVVVAMLGLGYPADRVRLPALSLPRVVFSEAYGLPWCEAAPKEKP
jgi:nitroreductase